MKSIGSITFTIFIGIASFGLTMATHSAQAAVITLDFEEQPSGNCAFIGTSFVSQGVQFTRTGSTNGFFACNAGIVNENTTSRTIVDANGQSEFDMVLVGGDPFDFLSFDAGTRTDIGGSATGIRLTGFFAGGGTISVDISFNGGDFDTFSLTGFQNLSSVSWLALDDVPGTQFMFDNIVIDVIDATTYSCSGFDSPMGAGAVKVKKNRVLPLKAQLFDSNNYEITDNDIVAPPVIQIFFDSGIAPATDVTDDALSVGWGTDGNQFEFDIDKWQFNLKTKNYSAAGTYTVMMESGDTDEYLVDPTCAGSFVID